MLYSLKVVLLFEFQDHRFDSIAFIWMIKSYLLIEDKIEKLTDSENQNETRIYG
jgi:hypothetical protein